MEETVWQRQQGEESGAAAAALVAAAVAAGKVEPPRPRPREGCFIHNIYKAREIAAGLDICIRKIESEPPGAAERAYFRAPRSGGGLR